MAFAAPEVCTITDLLPVALRRLGVADASGTGATTARGAAYSAAEIKQLLYQADFEIATLICQNLNHPYRTKFLTGETDALSDGALLPAHVAGHSRVVITNAGQQILGKPRSFERIKTICSNPAVYGAPKNLYAIHAGRIHFAHSLSTAKLDIPVIVKNEDQANLLSPLQYKWGVLASAIVMAANVGQPDAHRSYWANIWTMYAQMITSGGLALPEPEQLERLET